MKEYGLESSVSTSSLPPNFEDERIVQSARRVVPLEKINNKAQRRRRWFLGGAFVLAMTLGAGSALLASYLKLRNVPVTANEVSEVDVTPVPEPLAVADTATPDPPFVEEEEIAVPAALIEELPKKAPVVKRRTLAKHDEQVLEAPHAQKPSEEEDLNRIRDAVLFDEWQERRARRVMRRERRRSERNHRDLSNLDEIFEGRRRP